MRNRLFISALWKIIADLADRRFQVANGLHLSLAKKRKSYIAALKFMIVKEEVDNFVKADTLALACLLAPRSERVVGR